MSSSLLAQKVLSGNLRECKKLVTLGASVSFKAQNGATLYHFMVTMCESNEMYAWVFKECTKVGLTLEEVYDTGYTPVMVAISHGNLTALRWLVSKGVNLKHRNQDGHHSLHIAATSDNMRIVECVYEESLKAGMTIEDANDQGCTPVMLAAANGNLQNVKFFAKKGCNLWRLNREGARIIHLAASKGRVEVLEYLVELGLPDHCSIDEGVKVGLDAAKGCRSL